MTEVREIKLMVPNGLDAGEIQLRAEGVTERLSTPTKVLGVTVHQRPPPDWDVSVVSAVAAVLVAFEGDDVDLDAMCSEFGGRMARMYGLAMANHLDIRETTISLKGDQDAVDDLLENHGYSVGGDPDGDEEFTSMPGEDRADQKS